MKTRDLNRGISLCLLLFACNLPSLAQDKGGTIELTRSAIQSERQKIVTDAIRLTPQESEAFWPLYQEYQVELNKINDANMKILSSFTSNYDRLTDDESWQMLDDFVKYQREKAALQKKYANKFRIVLPPKKAARYFFLESKMDAVMNYDLAGSVPLAEQP